MNKRLSSPSNTVVTLADLAYPEVPDGAFPLLPLGATEPHRRHAPLEGAETSETLAEMLVELVPEVARS